MKLLKRILKVILIFISLVLLTILVILILDARGTRYLKVKNNTLANKTEYLITNANIIPMNRDTVLTDHMVYIKDGLIQNVAKHIDAEAVEVFDAEHKYLMPGLIDMHVHVWDRYELGLYLSSGVTAVRNLWGMPMHLRLKADERDNAIISPIFFTTGPKLTGPEFIGDDNLNLTSPEEAKTKVISYKERGYDFIKTYYGLTKDLFDAVIEQAEVSEVEIVAHPSQKVPYTYHFNPQIKSIEHVEDIVQQPLNYTLDTLKLNEVITNFSKSNQSSFCPTLIVYYNIFEMLNDDHILNSEQLQFINPLIKMVDSEAQFDRWYSTKQQNPSIVKAISDQHEFHLKIIKKLHDSGVSLICGTDSGIGVTVPGTSLHQELAFYKEAGLSNYEVLKTATVNASKTHSVMNDLGSIEANKIANLLVLDQNPLADVSALKNLSAVFVKGRKLDRGTLNSYKDHASNRSNLIASALRYLENLIVEK